MNRSAVNKWKHGGQPNGTTLERFAEYFQVSLDVLLGRKEMQPQASLEPAVPVQKPVQELNTELAELVALLKGTENVTFDGVPVSDEAKKTLATAIQLGMQAAGLEFSSTENADISSSL